MASRTVGQPNKCQRRLGSVECGEFKEFLLFKKFLTLSYFQNGTVLFAS